MSEANWPRGDYRPLATVRMTHEELQKRCSIDFRKDVEEGLGTYYWAALRVRGGVHFVLTDHLSLPGGRRIAIEVIHSGDLSATLESILFVLGLTRSELDWTNDNAHGAA